ncbi:MAG: hypothetical protein ACOZCO_13605 [Bacteroidota bacterium]
MSHRVQLKNDIIYQHADEGGLTIEKLKEDLEELLKIQELLKKEKKPFYMLYDGSNVGKVSSAVRAQALYNMSCLDYKRVAIIGVPSVFLNQLAKFIIMGMGKQKKIKIFKLKYEAENWLRNG